MQSEAANEIRSFLFHKELGTAVRRLLDLALETENTEFIRQAILLSKNFNAGAQKETPDLANNIEVLLKQIGERYSLKPRGKEMLVEAKNISKKYENSHFFLQPLSLSIRSGDIVGVVGENGNGKTTLLRSIAGQLTISSGRIVYGKIENADFFNIKNYVVFMPQRIPKWFGLLKDNLHFAASIAGVQGEENELMVDFMIERMGLTSFAHLTWDQISSGYRTRFELARILLSKPQLLILDEPLANLDINAQQTILSDLRQIAKSAYNPMGVLLSSQQLHEVEKVADEVIFIKNGASIYRNANANAHDYGYVLEFEATNSRTEIDSVVANHPMLLRFNGGVYTLESTSTSVNDMLILLVSSGIKISYFRDISNSTKRLFNN